MTLHDAHAHFFSPGFFRTIALDLPSPPADPAADVPTSLGFDPPVSDAALSDRWVAELDRHGVSRAMLIASAPGDEASVAAARARHPQRIVGAFMFNPIAEGAAARLDAAFGQHNLRTVCLFPAMHGFAIDDARVMPVYESAAQSGRAVFVHCGVLSVGIRKKLGLPSRFDLRRGDPLAVAAVAVKNPAVTFVIPHFGAGLFRETLMALDAASNIVVDSSSSNSWIKFHPGLTLRDVFARTLDCVGPARILFGTDSSFFPRGWQKVICDNQRAILTDLGVDGASQQQIFAGNFERVFGKTEEPTVKR